MIDEKNISIIIPAKNEAPTIGVLVAEIKKLHPHSEVIVVNDGSTDETASLAEENGARVISHPYSKGNGASIKTGSRAATNDLFVFMDGDGQHNPEDIKTLLNRVGDGYDMVIGARDFSSQASVARGIANTSYNLFASYMTGRKIEDLTSGFRAVKAELFKQFLYLLPNGFSYPTTITMSFFRAGYSVDYLPIKVAKRQGKSHINLLKDGIKFLLIIFKVGTLYSPMKIFFPVSMGFFGLGTGYYLYTFLSDGRFTNMGLLLFVTSVLVFLMGLLSEQVSNLIYRG